MNPCTGDVFSACIIDGVPRLYLVLGCGSFEDADAWVVCVEVQPRKRAPRMPGVKGSHPRYTMARSARVYPLDVWRHHMTDATIVEA